MSGLSTLMTSGMVCSPPSGVSVGSGTTACATTGVGTVEAAVGGAPLGTLPLAGGYATVLGRALRDRVGMAKNRGKKGDEGALVERLE